MADNTLHFPIDFLARPTTRALVALTNNAAVPFLLWVEWSGSRVEWRRDEPMFRSLVQGFIAEKLGGCDDIIGKGCESGFIIRRDSKGVDGFILDGFWECNRHLSPSFLSPQQMGSLSATASRISKKATAEARERLRVAVAKNGLPKEAVSDDIELSLRFLVRLSRSRGIPAGHGLRIPTADEAESILVLIRQHKEEDIVRVMEYLVCNRSNDSISEDAYTLANPEIFNQLMEDAYRERS